MDEISQPLLPRYFAINRILKIHPIRLMRPILNPETIQIIQPGVAESARLPRVIRRQYSHQPKGCVKTTVLAIVFDSNSQM